MFALQSCPPRCHSDCLCPILRSSIGTPVSLTRARPRWVMAGEGEIAVFRCVSIRVLFRSADHNCVASGAGFASLVALTDHPDVALAHVGGNVGRANGLVEDGQSSVSESDSSPGWAGWPLHFFFLFFFLSFFLLPLLPLLREGILNFGLARRSIASAISERSDTPATALSSTAALRARVPRKRRVTKKAVDSKRRMMMGVLT